MAHAKYTSPAKTSDAPNGSDEATQAPLFRKQYGHVVVSTWPKTVKTADRKERETTVSTVTREFRVGDERKRTHSLFPEDLLLAAFGLIKRWDELQGGIATEESSDA